MKVDLPLGFFVAHMSGADFFGLVVSVLVIAYLFYALIRGEKLVMTFAGWLTIVLFAVILTALAFPFGSYMAKVYTGKRVFLSPVFGLARALSLQVLRVDPEREQDWKAYAKSLIDLLARGLAAPVRDPAHPGRVLRAPRAEPARLPLRRRGTSRSTPPRRS